MRPFTSIGAERIPDADKMTGFFGKIDYLL